MTSRYFTVLVPPLFTVWVLPLFTVWVLWRAQEGCAVARHGYNNYGYLLNGAPVGAGVDNRIPGMVIRFNGIPKRPNVNDNLNLRDDTDSHIPSDRFGYHPYAMPTKPLWLVAGNCV